MALWLHVWFGLWQCVAAPEPVLDWSGEYALFDASLTLDDVAQHVFGFHSDRDLRCLDLFGGDGEMSRVFRHHGHNAAYYDIRRDPDNMDILTKRGFYHCLGLILRLGVGSILVAGPPYSLFVKLTSNYHKRTHQNPFGHDGLHEDVQYSNVLVSNLCVLLAVAFSRRVHMLLEQEYSSRMWWLPCMAACIKQYRMKGVRLPSLCSALSGIMSRSYTQRSHTRSLKF